VAAAVPARTSKSGAWTASVDKRIMCISPFVVEVAHSIRRQQSTPLSLSE
jgi:hypothetical protein